MRVLLYANSDATVRQVRTELRRGGYEPVLRRVKSIHGAQAELATGAWGVLIADYASPAGGGLDALGRAAAQFGVPLIVVCAPEDEPVALGSMRAAAADCVAKDRLSRLAPAVRRELRTAASRRSHDAARVALAESRKQFTAFTAEREAVEAALRDANRRLQVLSGRMIEIQEVERRRLAYELHDEIGQALTAVKIGLQSLSLHSAAGGKRRCDESLAIVDRALDQVRNLSLDLRPTQLDDLGLPAALRSQLDRQTRAAGLSVRFRTSEIPARLHPDLETVCFRIFQEALTNIMRHARAQKVDVRLELGTELTLSIADDGTGFDVAAARRRALAGRSLGIIGMEERAMLAGGRLELTSGTGKGTQVRAAFPLRYRDARAGRAP